MTPPRSPRSPRSSGSSGSPRSPRSPAAGLPGRPGRSEVADALGLGDPYGPLLEDLEQAQPGERPIALPPAGKAAEWLARLGCPPEVVADAVATLPDPRRDPERRWLVERVGERLVETMGDPGAPRIPAPQLPPELGVAGGCFWIHVFLAVMPETLAWHAARGLPEEVSWATLADLGRHSALHRETTGRSGVDEPWWMTLHLRAILFELGRLQFVTYDQFSGPEQPSPWMAEEEGAALGEGFRPGDPALSVHIPGGEPLTPESCEDSYRRARAFFDTFFPVRTRRVAVCSSWLLDEELDASLRPGSNVVTFRQAFHLVEGARRADSDVLWFVFKRRGPDIEALEERTSMQRAFAARLRAGGHFSCRSGWRDLPPAGAWEAGRAWT